MLRFLPLFVLLSACSVAPPGTDIHDPNEAHNREVHAFNKAISARFSSSDEGEAQVEAPSIPPELLQPIVNFSDNTAMPAMALNSLLQADIKGAVTNAFRFVLNTSIGIGGLFDPATAIGLPAEETDFGETLAVWGASEGAYIELPLLGPTTERALAGTIVDMVIDPLGSVGTQAQLDYGFAAFIGERLIKRSQYSDTIDSVLNDSADSYAQQRLIYMQNRRFDLGTTTDAVDPYADLYGE